MPACPTCGKRLDTERGMRQHHTMVHGEPLPNRMCKDCGTAFYDPKARLKYCDDCDPNAGRNNGNWRDAKETAECRLCGGEFEYYPSDKKGVYCPECVAESDVFLGDPYVKDAERVTKECEQWGIEMEVLQSTLDRGEGRVCSFDCLCEWMARNGRADQTAYGQNWKPVKQRALDRDNHTGQHCEKTASDRDRRRSSSILSRKNRIPRPAEVHWISGRRRCSL